MPILEMLYEGGGLIWIILGCAFVAIAITIYCAITLRRILVIPPLLEKAQDPETARTLALSEGGPFSEVVNAVIETYSDSMQEAECAIESAGRRAAHRLSRGIGALELIATLSPLLGLLGTVIGMYDAFKKIAISGMQEPGQLSGPISMALVTTIAGLIVAIPTQISAAAFGRHVMKLTLEMERAAMHLRTRFRSWQESR